jgi:diguanylate cyclase (GGDEF)-like protein
VGTIMRIGLHPAVANAGLEVPDALEHRVLGTAQLHFGLAYSRLLDTDDRHACSAYLAEVREAYPQYTGIITVRPDGRLHCDSLQSGRDLDLSDRSYFKAAMNSGKSVVLEPLFGRLTGNSVLQIVYPSRDDKGVLRFMLVASLNLQKFADEAQKQSLLATPPDVLLVDARGTVMAWSGNLDGPAKPGVSIAGSSVFQLAQAQQGGGTGERTGLGGQPQVWAVANSATARSAGMYVLLGLPRDALLASSELRLRQGLLVLGAAALVLFAGVWLLAERGIRRQVERIAHMVGQLGSGNLGSRIAAPLPRGELGGLMALLNSTADSLEQQRASIAELGDSLTKAHQREITERAQNEERLSRMANFDNLTGLPNRLLFHEQLRLAIARSKRSGRPFALMFLDLDRFKYINDSLGHDIGDRLLVAVSRAITDCLRDTDAIGRACGGTAGEGIFRVGGDEFTILTEELTAPESAKVVALRILSALCRPFMVDEHELFISASIGITIYADSDIDQEGLLKQADMAMYRAKEQGRDTYSFFDEELHREASHRHQLEGKLRHALERGEFLLHYQPKASLATGRVTGVEALLRWQPADQTNPVGPDEFIPVLEETGLIVAVGSWVLREACAQMLRWERAGMPEINLAVNLSARQFRHQDLVEQVSRILAETGFDAARLELELTESMLIDNSESVLGIITRLGAMRVRIAIDDFGTGQSSLSYLKRFNVDTLKIDRSFVQGIPFDSEDSTIATAVIALGHGLKLKVVAEGVERQDQADFLRAQGCDELQGYLLGRPLEAAAFLQWYTERRATAAILSARPADG